LQLSLASKKFSPSAAAAAVVAAMRSAKDLPKARQEALSAVRSFIDSMRSVGEAIARDETVSKTTEVVEQVGEEVEEIVGWQVISMRDNRVREKHRKRDGNTYYKEPKKGQLGLYDMPRPPYESQRDKGVRAWGCRCRLVAVFGKKEPNERNKNNVPAVRLRTGKTG
jgi:uncharacterized protein with gpF-like domain